jgi:hypothetical protein
VRLDRFPLPAPHHASIAFNLLAVNFVALRVARFGADASAATTARECDNQACDADDPNIYVFHDVVNDVDVADRAARRSTCFVKSKPSPRRIWREF